MYDIIINALADQLCTTLRRKYRFNKPEMRTTYDRSEALLTLYFNELGMPTTQIEDVWIAMVLAQPLGSQLHDGCVQMRLEMARRGHIYQQHQHLFELNDPALFDQIVQWSRSMLGRYSREIAHSISRPKGK